MEKMDGDGHLVDSRALSWCQGFLLEDDGSRKVATSPLLDVAVDAYIMMTEGKRITEYVPRMRTEKTYTHIGV